METNKTALVLGATGGIGGAIAGALLRHGWKVRGMARDAAAAHKQNQQIEWVKGDAMRRADVVEHARGVSVIVHAVNPPNYANWDKLVLPMIDNTIAAAQVAGGARILLPGTIYNFDPARTPVIDASTPQQPCSRKGAIRVELERRLEQAAPEVPSLILRAGDFFGPGTRASWFAQAMVTPGKPVHRITELTRDGGHSWAYLPDLAETAARLLDESEKLQPFERVQFEGYYDQSGTGLVEAISRVVGRKVATRHFPWWLMALLSPFRGFPREAAEIAPYWRYPVRLDNRRLTELIGPEPRTGLDAAVRTTLVHLGCLPESAVNALSVA
ncbi:NAD(P)H-binding protein [Archangium minus]|uniref:NAD(P)H-binding protein n=1 Tax=Archangium minus TaxID=83450 RepID=A0ABY9WG27_9BACT|nr:NAD(P)H-binding protein [Archangium minus]